MKKLMIALMMVVATGTASFAKGSNDNVQTAAKEVVQTVKNAPSGTTYGVVEVTKSHIVVNTLLLWYLFFDCIDYIDWKWLVGVAGIGVVCYIGLYVKLHKLLQKQKEEHVCLLKKQAKQTEEAVTPELEKVKGNWLKKEMIKRRLVREYVKRFLIGMEHIYLFSFP